MLSTTFDGARVVVDVAGPEVPDATDLVAELRDLLDPDDQVTVLFVERLDISTTTTTATTPTTSLGD